jgi:hypothetical protein
MGEIRVFDDKFEAAYAAIRIRLLEEFGWYLPETVDWHAVESTRPDIIGPLPEDFLVSAAIQALPEDRAIVKAARQALLEAITIGRLAWHGLQVLSGFNNQDDSPLAIDTRHHQRQFEQYCRRLTLLATVPQRYALRVSGVCRTDYSPEWPEADRAGKSFNRFEWRLYRGSLATSFGVPVVGTRCEVLAAFLKEIGEDTYLPGYLPKLPFEEAPPEGIMYFGRWAVRFIDDPKPLK